MLPPLHAHRRCLCHDLPPPGPTPLSENPPPHEQPPEPLRHQSGPARSGVRSRRPRLLRTQMCVRGVQPAFAQLTRLTTDQDSSRSPALVRQDQHSGSWLCCVPSPIVTDTAAQCACMAAPKEWMMVQHTSASAIPNTTDLHAAAAASVTARCHRLSPAAMCGNMRCRATAVHRIECTAQQRSSRDRKLPVIPARLHGDVA